MKITAPHLDDGTEAAIVGATTRSLDHVHLPAEQCISLEHTCVAVRQADFADVEGDGPCLPSHESLTLAFCLANQALCGVGFLLLVASTPSRNGCSQDTDLSWSGSLAACTSHNPIKTLRELGRHA
jgi:hypothetical protein